MPSRLCTACPTSCASTTTAPAAPNCCTCCGQQAVGVPGHDVGRRAVEGLVGQVGGAAQAGRRSARRARWCATGTNVGDVGPRPAERRPGTASRQNSCSAATVAALTSSGDSGVGGGRAAACSAAAGAGSGSGRGRRRAGHHLGAARDQQRQQPARRPPPTRGRRRAVRRHRPIMPGRAVTGEWVRPRNPRPDTVVSRAGTSPVRTARRPGRRAPALVGGRAAGAGVDGDGGGAARAAPGRPGHAAAVDRHARAARRLRHVLALRGRAHPGRRHLRHPGQADQPQPAAAGGAAHPVRRARRADRLPDLRRAHPAHGAGRGARGGARAAAAAAGDTARCWSPCWPRHRCTARWCWARSTRCCWSGWWPAGSPSGAAGRCWPRCCTGSRWRSSRRSAPLLLLPAVQRRWVPLRAGLASAAGGDAVRGARRRAVERARVAADRVLGAGAGHRGQRLAARARGPASGCRR